MHRAGLDLRHNFLVCICTRNREESLIRLLASIDDNNYEELRVLIVDSTFPEDRFFAFDPKKHVSRSLNLHRVQTTRGLPSARNIAVSHIDREDLVVFLDDDVTLPRDFFFKVNEYFASSPSSDALGVRIVNQYKASEGLIKKIFVKLREKNYGKITRSGQNIWLPDNRFGIVPVEWLPGCCMIFRKEVFSKLRFNEELEKGPTGGYALGEDVDFTYACSRSFKMEATDSISVNHHFEESPRDNEKAMVVASSLFKAHMKNSYPNNFSDIKIIFSQQLQNVWVHKNSTQWKIIPLGYASLINYLVERIRKDYLNAKTNEPGQP